MEAFPAEDDAVIPLQGDVGVWDGVVLGARSGGGDTVSILLST